MKRYGYLWDGMISFENLLRAAEKARARQTVSSGGGAVLLPPGTGADPAP